jgi:hypothetical protein
LRQISPHAWRVAPCELLPSQNRQGREMVRGQTFFPRETVQQTYVDVTGQNRPVEENKLFRFARSQRTLTCHKYLIRDTRFTKLFYTRRISLCHSHL